MAYLALARKYRPSSFQDIVGQEHVVRTLRNALRLGRVHHAFVLTGARGIGKTTVARILARAFNCVAEDVQAVPCGVCASCVAGLEGKHPDIVEIDGASHTGVDHIRQLRENVAYAPASGLRKIYIIDEVHMLSQAAFNALLKTLEEPPAHVVFIFATTEPHKIPATVMSRCQRFDLRRLSLAALTQHLTHILQQENLVLPASAVHHVAVLAQGSVRDGLSLLDQIINFAGEHPSEEEIAQALGLVDKTWAYSTCEHLLTRSTDALLQNLQQADLQGYDLTTCITSLCEHLRNLAVCKMATQPADVLAYCSTDEIERLQKQSALASLTDIHKFFTLALQLVTDLAHSPHPRMTCEMGLLKMLSTPPVCDIQTLLNRLDHVLDQQPNPVLAPRTETKEKTVAVQPPAAPKNSPTVFVHHDAWLQYVEKIRAMRPALASVLEHGRVLAFSAQKVQVAYTPGTFYYDAACDAENILLFNKTLQEHMGQACVLEIVALKESKENPPPASLAEQKKAQVAQAEQHIRAQAMQHPAVQNAVSILGAKIQDIRAETPLSTEQHHGSE